MFVVQILDYLLCDNDFLFFDCVDVECLGREGGGRGGEGEGLFIFMVEGMGEGGERRGVVKGIFDDL